MMFLYSFMWSIASPWSSNLLVIIHLKISNRRNCVGSQCRETDIVGDHSLVYYCDLIIIIQVYML